MNRIANLLLQSNGNIVVANAGNVEFCLFDPQGRFVRKFGRKGDGPGEFRTMTVVRLLAGDSVLLIDGLSRRVTVYGPTGTVGRSFTLVPPDTSLGFISSTVVMSDGALLLGFSEYTLGLSQPDAVMFRQRIFRTRPDGSAPTRIGSFPIGEHFIQQVAPEPGATIFWPLTFGRQFSAAPLGDGFVGGDGTSFDIREYAPDGRLRAIHRLNGQRSPVTPVDIAAYSDSSVRSATPQRRAREEQRVKQMPYPTHYPAYRRFLTDDAHRIWIEIYPTDGSSARWVVLEPGRPTPRGVTFPDRFRLLAVRGGRACGVARDDVDLETVQCFLVAQ